MTPEDPQPKSPVLPDIGPDVANLPAGIDRRAFTMRSALVGACAGMAFLLLLKDLRLMAVMPLLAALFFVLAPPQVSNRFMSMFDARDPTRVDSVFEMEKSMPEDRRS